MPEGERVLAAARRLLADADSLKRNVTAPKGLLSGHPRIGIIPTAEPLAGQITAAFQARQPNVTITLLSKTSNEIMRGISEHSLEAGISYVDQTPPSDFMVQHLYDETYVVIGSENLLGSTRTSISWQDAARLPLVLLNREMRNRRLVEILHAVQRALGCVPEQAQRLIAEAPNLSRAEVHGVVSFYHDFRARPAGRHKLRICRADPSSSS